MSQLKVTESLELTVDQYREKQYKLAEERDREHRIYGKCVLCLIGIPSGDRNAAEYHEAISKAKLRGDENLKLLYALPNICAACRTHHDLLQHEPLIWCKAMIRLKLARQSDYAVYIGRGLLMWEAKTPITADCLGDFGYGNTYYQTVPSSITAVFKKTNNALTHFCYTCCPMRDRCVKETAKKYDERDVNDAPFNQTNQTSDGQRIGELQVSA